jgi:hypothetical protein
MSALAGFAVGAGLGAALWAGLAVYVTIMAEKREARPVVKVTR